MGARNNNATISQQRVPGTTARAGLRLRAQVLHASKYGERAYVGRELEDVELSLHVRQQPAHSSVIKDSADNMRLSNGRMSWSTGR